MSTLAVRPARDLRNHYAEINAMVQKHQPVIITNRGHAESVVISLDEYNELQSYVDRFDEAWIAHELEQTEQRIASGETTVLDEKDFKRALGWT
ncbi:MAG: type II toxin-antitoxin system Phd/YefM family antitoxin [Coriobacteriales bacterium]|jgi:prevent-host-death family protein|nr:type II toxin-antitoxin system Phd/YefM family antitoxin [Coriobacteriales bacterium]